MIDHEYIADEIAENVMALPFEEISIMTPTKDMIAHHGLILGDWALNRNVEGWVITDRASGTCGESSFATPIEALIEFGIFLGAGLVIPTPYPGTLNDVEDIAAIRARIKVAHQRLSSYNLAPAQYEEEDHL